MESQVAPNTEVFVQLDNSRLKLYKLVICHNFNPDINKVLSVNGKWLGCWRSTHLCSGDL